MTETQKSVGALLKPLIEQAREQGLWLHCRYQNIWMSPDDLERENTAGRFLWGPVNWILRDPQEYVAQARLEVEKANNKLARVLEKTGQT